VPIPAWIAAFRPSDSRAPPIGLQGVFESTTIVFPPGSFTITSAARRRSSTVTSAARQSRSRRASPPSQSPGATGFSPPTPHGRRSQRLHQVASLTPQASCPLSKTQLDSSIHHKPYCALPPANAPAGRFPQLLRDGKQRGSRPPAFSIEITLASDWILPSVDWPAPKTTYCCSAEHLPPAPQKPRGIPASPAPRPPAFLPGRSLQLHLRIERRCQRLQPRIFALRCLHPHRVPRPNPVPMPAPGSPPPAPAER